MTDGREFMARILRSARSNGGRQPFGGVVAEAGAALPLLIVLCVTLTFLLFDILAIGFYKVKLAAVTDSLARIAARNRGANGSEEDYSETANKVLKEVGLPDCASCKIKRFFVGSSLITQVDISITKLPIIPVESITGSAAGLCDRSVAFQIPQRGILKN